MTTISEALERKKQQLPQFDYLWRVELPEITVVGMTDPMGTALLNTAVPALDVIGGGNFPAVERFKNFANEKIGDLSSTVSSYAQKSIDFAKETAAGIPGYSAVENFLNGGNTGGFLRSQTAIASLLKSNSKGSVLSHRVFAVDMPYQSFEVVRHTFGSSFFFSAGTNEVGSLSLKLDEYEDGDSLRYIEAWKALIVNPDGTYNPPATYKRDIRLIRMSNSGLDLHVSVYKNCFPSEVSPSNFSYDSNSITQYNITFTGDSVEHIFIPGNDVLAAVASMQPQIMQGNGYGDGDFFSLSAGNIFNAGLPAVINKALDNRTITKLVDKVKNFFF